MSYKTCLINTAILIAAAVLASVAAYRVDRNSFAGSDTVSAEEGWRQEFEIVCSRTEEAMTLSTDELKVLIKRCDKLKPVIDGLPESPRKVYLRRLQLCRDLYAFVLESKEKDAARSAH